MSNTEKMIANLLLQIKAIKLNPTKPFTWASGLKSPIYCDNRKTLSYPEVRTTIKSEFVKIIKENFKEVEVIAGVATGGIAIGALVADCLSLPFVYVRTENKSHGLENRIEGVVEPEQKVVVVEDLISTGASSLQAVDALNASGCKVLGMVAIFTYNFEVSKENFEKKQCQLFTLSNYNVLIETALEQKAISESDALLLAEWRKNPQTWR